MTRQRETFTLIVILVISTIVLVGLTWLNFQFVTQDMGFNDFLPGWAGTRWLMVRGWSPYSTETTQGIQQLVFGRSARPSEEQGFFLYPLYSGLIYAPFSLMEDYYLARALWMTVLEVALFGVLLASLSLSSWRPPVLIVLVLLIFIFTWYHSVLAILDSQMLVLCTLFLVLALLAIRSNNDVLGGFLLALTSVRPEIMVLFIVFVLIWSFSQQRWQLIWSFIASSIFMIAITSLIIPGWPFENLRQFYTYIMGASSNTLKGQLTYWLPGIGNQLGWAFTLIIIGMLVWEWRSAIGQDFRWFYWTACLTLAAIPIIGIPISLEQYVVLIPGLILVLSAWNVRLGNFGILIVLVSILAFVIGGWGLSVLRTQNGIPPTLDPMLHLAMPTLLILGLYWVRRTVIHPQQLPLQILANR